MESNKIKNITMTIKNLRNIIDSIPEECLIYLNGEACKEIAFTKLSKDEEEEMIINLLS